MSKVIEAGMTVPEMVTVPAVPEKIALLPSLQATSAPGTGRTNTCRC